MADEYGVEWKHLRFGTHVGTGLGVRLLVRMAYRGRTPVAYVATVGGWHSRDVPFGADRKAALAEAKALAVAHVTHWGPPDPTDGADVSRPAASAPLQPPQGGTGR